MKKLKLLALRYGPEDERAMQAWLDANAASFEIAEWSSPLEVPIQSAVAHYRESSGIDGLLIDDYCGYDPIVMSRLSDLLKPVSMSLYSITNADRPVIAFTPKSNTLQATGEEKNHLHLLALHPGAGHAEAQHPALMVG